MIDFQRHLVELARDVVDAIEKCGTSQELTYAEMLAFDLYCYLRKPVTTSHGDVAPEAAAPMIDAILSSVG